MQPPSVGRMFSVQFGAVAVTAAQDLFEIQANATRPIRVHALFLSQTSDVGDAQEEILRVTVRRGFTTSGSGGTAPTATQLNPNDVNVSATTEVNNTTVATGGTNVILHDDAWNVRIPYQLILTPEMRWGATNAQFLVVRLEAAPADSLTMNGTLYFSELR